VSIRNSAEIADGTIPVFMDPHGFELFGPHLNAGFAKTSNRRSLPFVPVSMADAAEALAAVPDALVDEIALLVTKVASGPSQKAVSRGKKESTPRRCR
jgi:hypothetical protein